MTFGGMETLFWIWGLPTYSDGSVLVDYYYSELVWGRLSYLASQGEISDADLAKIFTDTKDGGGTNIGRSAQSWRKSVPNGQTAHFLIIPLLMELDEALPHWLILRAWIHTHEVEVYISLRPDRPDDCTDSILGRAEHLLDIMTDTAKGEAARWRWAHKPCARQERNECGIHVALNVKCLLLSRQVHDILQPQTVRRCTMEKLLL